ncbi:hypothetical protein [Streptomyces sp. NPDC088246]|uniref:hypothetical protein n=1 Tax=Streptomyces sp. NPDC088246 TaxID=3365842 RepID=UPI0038307E8B
MPLKDLAEIVRRLATAVDFADLAQTAKALAKAPDHPQALYDFGYSCVERGVSFLGVPALREALRQLPDARPLRTELISALEKEYRHAEAVTVLGELGAELPMWPERYLLARNCLLSGQFSRARDAFAPLLTPQDDTWLEAHGRLTDMLRRAERAAMAGPLDDRDLRGWHLTLTGGYLATLSPYGFESGMNGRYAYLQDTYALCRGGIDRLAIALRAAGRAPQSVTVLPGRSDRILGLATAEVLGLPAEPYAPQRRDTVVVAYDLNEIDDDVAESLRERPEGQILFEHATCWTDPPVAAADVSTLLAQTVVAPWGTRLHMGEDGPERVPPDTREEAEIAAEIVRSDAAPDPGDGETPTDTDAMFSAFVAATAQGWSTGPRPNIASPGPVPSSKFA